MRGFNGKFRKILTAFLCREKKRVHHQLDFNLKAVKFGDEIKLSVRSSSIISNFTCRRSRESRGLVTFKTETKCAKFRRSDGE